MSGSISGYSPLSIQCCIRQYPVQYPAASTVRPTNYPQRQCVAANNRLFDNETKDNEMRETMETMVNWRQAAAHCCTRLLTVAHSCSLLHTAAHCFTRLLTVAHGCSLLHTAAHCCTRLFTVAHGCSLSHTGVNMHLWFFPYPKNSEMSRMWVPGLNEQYAPTHGTVQSFLEMEKTADAYSLQIYDYLSQIQPRRRHFY